MFGSAAAHAAYQSRSALAGRVTRSTKAAQSTVVGFTKDRSHAYVRSEGTKGGKKYIITRLVESNTGKIVSTSGNQLPGIKSRAALAERNGAKGGQGGDYRYGIRVNRNAMTDKGNVKITATNAGFPGRNEGRIVKLSKTGAFQDSNDSPTDGLKARK
jgi:hypothetical protein